MPNIKAKKKSVVKMEENRERNLSTRRKMKTMVKYVETAVESKDAEKIKAAVADAISSIDRAASKGVIHANQAARRKSVLMTRVAGQA